MATTRKAPAKGPAKAPARAADVSAPVREVRIDGQVFPLVFNNRCYRVVEDVYEQAYGRRVNVYAAMDELGQVMHRAVEAFVYAGAVAGGYQGTFEDFDSQFQLSDLQGFADMLTRALLESVPESAEGSAKNG